MECTSIAFSDHAVGQMFRRGISVDEVKEVLISGEVIADYPTDKPFPSCLSLGFINNRPLHLVIAKEPETGRCIIVTTYIPDPAIWDTDYKTKRK